MKMISKKTCDKQQQKCSYLHHPEAKVALVQHDDFVFIRAIIIHMPENLGQKIVQFLHACLHIKIVDYKKEKDIKTIISFSLN